MQEHAFIGPQQRDPTGMLLLQVRDVEGVVAANGVQRTQTQRILCVRKALQPCRSRRLFRCGGNR
jgi:hypothetical protein